mmetsp:Transcript_23109/g.57472  ORF Transcript_23109/g.57472 Transcript_23109/m.57472 type:complete len:87 (-) Transcript_23109:1376-1636(-)
MVLMQAAGRCCLTLGFALMTWCCLQRRVLNLSRSPSTNPAPAHALGYMLLGMLRQQNHTETFLLLLLLPAMMKSIPAIRPGNEAAS